MMRRTTSSGAPIRPNIAAFVSGERAERVESTLEHDVGVVVAEPLLDRRRVDAAEIRRHLQIPVVEIREARRTSVEAGFDPIVFAEEKHGTCCAVVRAEAAVLFDAASELGEH